MENKKISKIEFNWFFIETNGEEYTRCEVGKNGVVSIEEHKAQYEGDKWYYDVTFEDGRVIRIFNPNIVEFKKLKEGE